MFTWVVVIGYIDEDSQTARTHFQLQAQDYTDVEDLAKKRFVLVTGRGLLDIREVCIMRLYNNDSEQKG